MPFIFMLFNNKSYLTVKLICFYDSICFQLLKCSGCFLIYNKTKMRIEIGQIIIKNTLILINACFVSLHTFIDIYSCFYKTLFLIYKE